MDGGFIDLLDYNNRAEIIRPGWVDYYLGLALLIKERSCDGQTKHACVITDKQHRPLGFGYNSFPRKMPDDLFPNLRPSKYPFMIHAEVNAVSNCSADLNHLPGGAIAYVTGQICYECAKHLYQNNVMEWFMANRHGTNLHDDEADGVFHKIVSYGGVKIHYVNVDLDWIRKAV